MGFLRFIRRHILLFVILFILLAGGAAVLSQTAFKQEETESVIVNTGDIKKTLTLSGEIKADQVAKLKFLIGGNVVWVGVKEGDTVAKYQTIAVLDQRSALKNLQDALLDYSLQRNDFEKVQNENAQRTPQQALNYNMELVLENNQYNLEKAVVSVQLQELARQQSVLTSPIDGLVTKAEIPYPDVAVLASQTPYEIVNPNSVYFQVNADQTEVTGLSASQSGTIVFDSYPDEELVGSISQISFSPDPEETGTVYPIKISLSSVDNSSYKYRLGMTGDITFVLETKKNVVLLPSRFLKTDNQGTYVLTGKDRKKTYVKTGLEDDESTEIVSGLSVGEVVYD